MPVAVLLRILFRLLGGLLFWRFATARRSTGAGRPARPAGRPPTPQLRIDMRERVRRFREGVSIAWRLLALTVMVAAGATLIAAGVGPAVLGPRWLGIVLLVLAIAALGLGLLESLALRRALRVRSRRRHDADLTRQVYP